MRKIATRHLNTSGSAFARNDDSDLAPAFGVFHLWRGSTVYGLRMRLWSSGKAKKLHGIL